MKKQTDQPLKETGLLKIEGQQHIVVNIPYERCTLRSPCCRALCPGADCHLAFLEGRTHLYVEADAQWLLHLDPQTGTILWEYAEAEAEISPPAFSPRGDVVYVVTRQQIGTSAYEVTVLTVEKRHQLWQQRFVLPTHRDRVQAPIAQEELLLVPLGDVVTVLRTTDGHRLAT